MEKSEAVKNALPQFHKQVTLFKKLGKTTVDYMKNIRTLQSSLRTFNDTALQLCQEEWPGFNKFKNVLRDSEDLYSILEEETAVKFGNVFGYFGDQFLLVQESIEAMETLQTEMKNFRCRVDRVNHSTKSIAIERERANQMLHEKEKEYAEIERMILQKVESLHKSQRLFVYEHYGKFVTAHNEFCKDCLTVYEIIDECIRGFMPKKKDGTVDLTFFNDK